jgi:hypothetical protein
MYPLNNQSPSNRTFREEMQFLIFAALILIAASTAVRAQILYGTLTGNVTDQSGAIVRGAKVEAVNTGTGSSTSVTTDERGAYQFNNLQAGIYKVTITASSFKSRVQDSVRIDANIVLRVDAQLEVGDVNATVEVSAAPAAIQTDRADVNTQIQAKDIENLPITSSAGRNFQALYRIVPGFSQVTEGFTSDGGNPQRSMGGNVNGTSRQSNLTRIDGASNAYIWLPENTAPSPAPTNFTGASSSITPTTH